MLKEPSLSWLGPRLFFKWKNIVINFFYSNVMTLYQLQIIIGFPD